MRFGCSESGKWGDRDGECVFGVKNEASETTSTQTATCCTLPSECELRAEGIEVIKKPTTFACSEEVSINDLLRLRFKLY
jgi:hypothetical protein